MMYVSQHAHAPIPRSSSEFFVCYAPIGNVKGDSGRTQQNGNSLKTVVSTAKETILEYECVS